MKATIDVPDELYRQVKAKSALEGSAKPGFVDRVIHANYRRSGAEQLVTFERAAAKLAGVRVLQA